MATLKDLFHAAAATMACIGFPSAALTAHYSEAISGDISNLPQSPMDWELEVGPNILSGTAGGNFFAGASDYDLVTLIIPSGQQLDSIIVSNYVNIDEYSMSFLGLESGPKWTDGLGWDIQGYSMLGWTHLQSFMVGGDVLQEIRDHSNLSDFPVALPSGAYTLLIEDVDTVFEYSFVFNVSAVVPEPSSAVMMALASCFHPYRRRPHRERPVVALRLLDGGGAGPCPSRLDGNHGIRRLLRASTRSVLN